MTTTQIKNLVGHGISNTNVALVAEKIEEWDMFYRFLEYHPEIREKYEVYKTYEILKK